MAGSMLAPTNSPEKPEHTEQNEHVVDRGGMHSLRRGDHPSRKRYGPWHVRRGAVVPSSREKTPHPAKGLAESEERSGQIADEQYGDSPEYGVTDHREALCNLFSVEVI